MKLSQLNIKKAVNDGVWVDILMVADVETTDAAGNTALLREGEPSGLRVKIRGTDSEVYRDLQEKMMADRLKKKGGARDESPAEIERRAVDTLVAMTADWDGFEDDAGQPIPFSTKAARAIYEDAGYRWLRDQVDLAANQRRRFFVG